MSDTSSPSSLATTRRQWLVLAGSAGFSGLGALGGCGGGMVAEGPPGTGGSGLYASGPVGGFGSVIVNGLKLDDSSASVKLDGQGARSADLRLGMVASVTGQRGSGNSTGDGSATSIEVWSIAQGPVTALGGHGQFTVAGMALQADGATVLDSISSVDKLALGQRVTVWGLQGGADGRSWTATRVALNAAASAATVATTGYLTLAGSQRFMNGLLLTGALADTLQPGPLVRVQGLMAADGSLALTGAQNQGTAASLPPQVQCEVSGLVTSTGGAGGAYSNFMLGNYPVDATGVTVTPAGSALAVGAQVRVSGSWLSGVLKVSSVAVVSEQARRTVQITAPIEQFGSIADFVVRGQHCDASVAGLVAGAVATDFKSGVAVQLTGIIDGDVVRVSSLAKT